MLNDVDRYFFSSYSSFCGRIQILTASEFIPENPSAGGKSTIPEKKIQEKKGLLKTLHTLFRI